jgi:di/tricarboxylate transporter
MSGRSASWLAWSACVLSLALTALSLLLLSLTLLRSDSPIYYYAGSKVRFESSWGDILTRGHEPAG